MSEELKELAILKDDPWLEPYFHDIHHRLKVFENTLSGLLDYYGGFDGLTKAYEYFGFNYDKKSKAWIYREWAPEAHALFLTGDFNQWERYSHPLKRNDKGIWEITLPDAQYADTFVHESLFKVVVQSEKGEMDRIPTFIQRVVQDEDTKDFAAQHWAPAKKFSWSGDKFDAASIGAPLIYECHTGMAQEKEGLGTYREFADNILPRIKALGYNTIQLMAVQEHPYYGSFGYHVSSFFAPSSRFGTPEDLKYLIKTAHKMGIAVIMDIVHSHAVKNLNEGLNQFDGSDHQYFHEGGRGNHDGWDSKLFNYGKWEVVQFLLSNVRYWVEEFHFDGFRFDGVTSMMYTHHGFTAFDHYDKYFKYDLDPEAITYLQLANYVAHEVKQSCITIAEDVSGMPGLGLPIQEGGVGFDYRLGMGIPDFWIKYLKHMRDEDWNIHELWGTLTNRRWNEKTIGYAESHDQALVGDKSVAFWLMDKEMYWFMRKSDESLIIDRGIALHKLIRLFTASLGGEGYLNFIGNEFGHPEWIDFPREGNEWSYKYARRQWSLVDNEELRYMELNDFDQAMVNVLKENGVLGAHHAKQLNMDETNKTIIYERGGLIFIVNFHPENSVPGYEFWVPEAGKYSIILNSDAGKFGGHDRVDTSVVYETNEENRLSVYVTSRTCLVLKKVEEPKKAKAAKSTTAKKAPAKAKSAPKAKAKVEKATKEAAPATKAEPKAKKKAAPKKKAAAKKPAAKKAKADEPKTSLSSMIKKKG